MGCAASSTAVSDVANRTEQARAENPLFRADQVQEEAQSPATFDALMAESPSLTPRGSIAPSTFTFTADTLFPMTPASVPSRRDEVSPWGPLGSQEPQLDPANTGNAEASNDFDPPERRYTRPPDQMQLPPPAVEPRQFFFAVSAAETPAGSRRQSSLLMQRASSGVLGSSPLIGQHQRDRASSPGPWSPTLLCNSHRSGPPRLVVSPWLGDAPAPPGMAFSDAYE